MNPVVLTEGYARATAVAREHARSFYFASFALGGARRRAALALYAFCRRLDDLVDASDAPAATLPARLAETEALVHAVHAGTPLPATPGPWHPSELAALRDTVVRFGIPVEPFVDLLRGVGMDLVQHRYATFADLDVYCYRVAGTVGLMLTPVLGYRDEAALDPAADLGRAMQLTNILRDVGEDLARGRIYLPLDELAAAGLCEDDLFARRVDERFRRFMRGQIDRARRYYARAATGVRHLDGPRSRLCVRLMAGIYADILRVIEAQGHDVFRRRAVVTGRRKLVLAARALQAERAVA